MDVASRSPRFREKLDLLLGLRRMSQAELARRVSAMGDPITPAAIGRYLGGAAPSPDIARRIAQSLDVDPVWMVDEGEPVPVNEFTGVIGPIPRFGSDLSTVETTMLHDELLDRYKAAASVFRRQVMRVASLDWPPILDALRSVDDLSSAPPIVAALVRYLAHGRNAIDVFNQTFDCRVRIPKESASTGEDVTWRAFNDATEPLRIDDARIKRHFRDAWSRFGNESSVFVEDVDIALEMFKKATDGLVEAAQQLDN